MFVPTTPPPASPEAEDLGLQIAELVLEYRERNPDVSGRDVIQAFAVARASLRTELGGAAASGPQVFAVVLGILACLGGLVFFLQTGNVGGQFATPVVGGLIVALAAIFAVRKLAGR